jgi:Sec-independent protein translocase protein TatA
MLVRLTSSTSGEMIMYAEHARRLFEIIGKEGTARGVFTREQLPEAVERLHQAVREEKLELQEAERKAREEGLVDDEESGDEDVEAKEAKEEAAKSGRTGVTLGQRAYPLIHLMELTCKEDGFILWEASGEF